MANKPPPQSLDDSSLADQTVHLVTTHQHTVAHLLSEETGSLAREGLEGNDEDSSQLASHLETLLKDNLVCVI